MVVVALTGSPPYWIVCRIRLLWNAVSTQDTRGVMANASMTRGIWGGGCFMLPSTIALHKYYLKSNGFPLQENTFKGSTMLHQPLTMMIIFIWNLLYVISNL